MSRIHRYPAAIIVVSSIALSALIAGLPQVASANGITGKSGWATTVTIAPAATASPVVTGALPTQVRAPHTLQGANRAPHALQGIASYYWQDQMTSSGERFNKNAMTAAHKTLPMGTQVKVTHASNGRSVVVRINDRGPFKPGRVIDLSEAAAKEIQMTGQGLANVRIEVLR